MAIAKREKAWKSKLAPGKQYSIDDALKMVKEFATAKFNETVDCAVNLGIDAAKSDQQVRGSTVMPHGTGKTLRVAVFTAGKNVELAKAAGAEVIVIHPGFLLERERVDAIDAVVRQLGLLRERLEAKDRLVPFGVEVMGRVRDLGSADDVIEIARRMDGWIRPVL